MNKLLFLGSVLLVTSACNATTGATLSTSSNSYQDHTNWKISCGPQIDKEAFTQLSKDSFRFHIDVGDIGGCKSDRKNVWNISYNNAGPSRAERQEVNKQNLAPGKYKFSATIINSLEDKNADVYRSNIIQIMNDLGPKAPPPSTLVFRKNNLKVEGMDTTFSKWIDVPVNSTFDLDIDFEFTPTFLTATYYIDGEKFYSGTSKLNPHSEWGVAFKFGIYRIAATSAVTRTYNNVKLTRVK